MNDQIIDGEVVEKKTDADPKMASEALADDVQPFSEPARIGFRENLRRVLQEAGISMRKFYLLLGCLGIFLIALIVFLYFLIQILFTDSEGTPRPDTPTQEEKQELEGVDTVTVPRTKSAFYSSLSLGVMIGTKAAEVEDFFTRSLEAAMTLGFSGVAFDISNEILQSINTIKKLDSVLDVNVNLLLEQNPEREKALESYLDQSKRIFAEATLLQIRLNSIMNDYKSQFETVSQDKQLYEDAYFANVEQLSGPEAEEALKRFIELAKQQSQIRAEFEARKKLKLLLDPRISRLELRIKAIELNKEALIKGITIVPVEGSGIDLIENGK